MKEKKQMSLSITMVCVYQASTVYSNYANVTLTHLKLTCPITMLCQFICCQKRTSRPRLYVYGLWIMHYLHPAPIW